MRLNHSTRRRPRASRPTLFPAIATLMLLLSPPALAQLNVTGRWTPLPTTTPPAAGSEANWEHLQVHMALLRGDENYHSYILSWNLVPDDSTWEGGLWGWNPPDPDDGCLAYPASTLVQLTQPASPEVQIFCAGLAALPDGRLLVTGGTDRVGETAGIKDVRVFDAQSRSWSAEDTMAFRRYYPTNTTLPDGRILVTEGWQYDHMLTFGGRSVPEQASSARKDLGRLSILKDASWDAPITDPGGATPWPEERAHHTAVERQDPGDLTNSDLYRMILFGGLDTAGVARDDAWALVRSQWYDNTERYVWEELPSGPARARHGAIVASNQSMYVFGGIDASTPPVVQSDVRRLSRVGQSWQWDVMSTSGTDTPGARYGHTVAYDVSSGRNRMIVFGGSDSSGLADNEVYALDFGSMFNSFTWERLDRVSGSPSPPAAREAHTMVIDSRKYTRNSVANWTRMIVYGGEESTGLTDELWLLWVHPSEDKVEWEQLAPSTPSGAPAARAGHAAIWQRPTNQDRMLVFGGETASGSDAEVWALSITGNDAGWIPEGTDGPALAGHTGLLDLIPTQAALPEIYDPAASPGERWTSLSAPKRYQYYPFTFVLPSGDVFLAGPQVDTYRLDLDVPQWSSAIWGNFWAWSAAMYRPGEILKIGGKGQGGYDTARIEFDESNANTGWIQASTNLVDRYLPNLTILPDGRVVATGGTREPSRAPAARRPQIWTPPAEGVGGVGAWSDTALAPDPAARDHHSTAILLPDGRVLTAGVSDLEIVDSEKATIFCPPYLFSADSLAARPVLSAAPDTVVWGHAFSVSSPQADSIFSAALVKPSAVTHSFNQDQRYVPLDILDTLPGGELVLGAPAGGTWAPPGNFMLFLVNTSGVPSIAKWVRVRGQAESGGCADISPADIALLAPDVGRNSVKLTWTAPGENGTCGTAYSYDVRRSTSAITESNFYGATRVTANVPSPPMAGSDQCMEVDSLSSCATHRFAIKTRDAHGVWSKISNSASATTQCSGFAAVICDGGGLLAGGGGGGGEGALRHELQLAGAAQTPVMAVDEAAGENSVLWPTESGNATDFRRMTGLAADTEGRYSIQLRQIGTWKTYVDQLLLGVVDHGAEEVAVGGADSVLVGTREAVAGVTDGDGVPVDGLSGGEAQPHVLKAGTYLTVRLSGATRSTALVVESSGRAASTGEDLAGILVQAPGPEGAWTTVGEVQPRRQFDRCAVVVGQSASVRLVFPRTCTVRSLAQLEVARRVLPEPLDLLAATKRGTGTVTDVLGQAGGEATSMAPGDSLTMTFAAPQDMPQGARDLFLIARGSMEPTPSQGAMESAGLASEVRDPYVYSLGQARPNPSAGEVTIDFTLAQRSPVSLRVYDVAGRLVRSLVNEELAEGPQSILWDGRTETGLRVGAGVFFYRVAAGGWHSERKLIVLQR